MGIAHYRPKHARMASADALPGVHCGACHPAANAQLDGRFGR